MSWSCTVVYLSDLSTPTSPQPMRSRQLAMPSQCARPERHDRHDDVATATLHLSLDTRAPHSSPRPLGTRRTWPYATVTAPGRPHQRATRTAMPMSASWTRPHQAPPLPASTRTTQQHATASRPRPCTAGDAQECRHQPRAHADAPPSASYKFPVPGLNSSHHHHHSTPLSLTESL